MQFSKFSRHVKGVHSDAQIKLNTMRELESFKIRKFKNIGYPNKYRMHTIQSITENYFLENHD